MRFRIVPVLPSVGGKSFAEKRSQLDLLFAEFACPTHRFINAHRLGLAGYSNEIEFARLNDILR